MVTGARPRRGGAAAGARVRRPQEPERTGGGEEVHEDQQLTLVLVEVSRRRGELGDGRKPWSTAADQRRESIDFSGFAASWHEQLKEEEERSAAELLVFSPEQEVAVIRRGFSPDVARVSGELRKEETKWEWLRVSPERRRASCSPGKGGGANRSAGRRGTAERTPPAHGEVGSLKTIPVF